MLLFSGIIRGYHFCYIAVPMAGTHSSTLEKKVLVVDHKQQILR